MITVPQLEPEGFDKGRGPVGSPPPGRLLTCPHCPVRVPARVPLSNPGAHAQPARQRPSARMAAVASREHRTGAGLRGAVETGEHLRSFLANKIIGLASVPRPRSLQQSWPSGSSGLSY